VHVRQKLVDVIGVDWDYSEFLLQVRREGAHYVNSRGTHYSHVVPNGGDMMIGTPFPLLGEVE
jgi:hypothetical protein